MQSNSDQLKPATEKLLSLGVPTIGSDRLRGVGRGTQTDYENENLEELCGECWKRKLCVTATGDTYPCVFARKTSLGNAKDGLAPLIESSALERFRLSVKALAEQRQADANEVMCYPPHATHVLLASRRPRKGDTCRYVANVHE
jgi:MoaA/NifB/PqqE/SkfB family radical SAM enzyme